MINENPILYKISSSVQIIEQPELSPGEKEILLFFLFIFNHFNKMFFTFSASTNPKYLQILCKTIVKVTCMFPVEYIGSLMLNVIAMLAHWSLILISVMAAAHGEMINIYFCPRTETSSS